MKTPKEQGRYLCWVGTPNAPDDGMWEFLFWIAEEWRYTNPSRPCKETVFVWRKLKPPLINTP